MKEREESNVKKGKKEGTCTKKGRKEREGTNGRKMKGKKEEESTISSEFSKQYHCSKSEFSKKDQYEEGGGHGRSCILYDVLSLLPISLLTVFSLHCLPPTPP
jgi:hypothetical protein